jgi:hypothetical protein
VIVGALGAAARVACELALVEPALEPLAVAAVADADGTCGVEAASTAKAPVVSAAAAAVARVIETIRRRAASRRACDDGGAVAGASSR